VKEMIGRTYPISASIFLSIISHGVLIFSLMFFWEVNFPLGSEPQSDVISVTLIGKRMEKTSNFLDSDNLITPVEKNKKAIGGDSNVSIDPIFPSYQMERNTQGNKPKTTEGDSLQVMDGSEKVPEIIPNHSRKEEVRGMGLEIGEQIIAIENSGVDTPTEVYKKMGPTMKLNWEVNQRTFTSQAISVMSNASQKDVEAFEKNLVSAERNPPEGVSEGSLSEKDPEWVSYQMELVRLIEKGKRYPLFAKLRNMSGVVVVGFTLGAEGRASDIEVIRSSDQKILDREALDTIRRVSPFPPFPDGFKLPRMNLSISLKFDLKKS